MIDGRFIRLRRGNPGLHEIGENEEQRETKHQQMAKALGNANRTRKREIYENRLRQPKDERRVSEA